MNKIARAKLEMFSKWLSKLTELEERKEILEKRVAHCGELKISSSEDCLYFYDVDITRIVNFLKRETDLEIQEFINKLGLEGNNEAKIQ